MIQIFKTTQINIKMIHLEMLKVHLVQIVTIQHN